MKCLRAIALLVVLLPTILLSGAPSPRVAGGAAHALREAAGAECAVLQPATTEARGAIADPFTAAGAEAGQWRGRTPTPRTPFHDPMFRVAFVVPAWPLPASRLRARLDLRSGPMTAPGNFCRRSVQRLI